MYTKGMPDKIWLSTYGEFEPGVNRVENEPSMQQLDVHTRMGFQGYYKHTLIREHASTAVGLLKEAMGEGEVYYAMGSAWCEEVKSLLESLEELEVQDVT